ncbi:MAG: transcriptional regulator [Actinomycetia bacterium]|nr:transcriptional regulator [Actinomycetes bacterium]
MDDGLSHQFRVLGLDRLPARLYQFLLTAPPARPAEIAARIGERDLDDVEGALAELVELGLVGGPATGYRPIAPAAALTILERRRTARITEAKAGVLQMYENVRRIAGAQPVDGMEALDATQTRVRLEGSVRAARQEVRTLDTPPYGPVADPGRPANGVRSRTICSREALEFPGHLASVVLPAIGAGAQTRTLPELPVKLHLVDDQIGFVELTSHEADSLSTALVVHRCSVLTALIGLFESAWAQALPLDPGAGLDGGAAIRGGDKLLLALLCAGLADDITARELGISQRTYYRRLRLLMARTGATTRFQLAVHATRAGWIP